MWARKWEGAENAVYLSSSWGSRNGGDDESLMRLGGSSSKMTISSTQKTARALAMVPARYVFWSCDWALLGI